MLMGSASGQGPPAGLLEAVHTRLPEAVRFTYLDDQPFGPGRLARRLRLHNGLTVLAVVDPSAPIFAYHTWFRVGSRHERPGRTGIAHLFEHLMFKATKNLADGEFDRILERRGAQTNAATWVDWTYYHEALPARGDNLETVIRLEADRMQNMILNDTQLEAEREVVKNERRYRVEDDPDGKMYELLYDLALPGHPYGWPTIGWMEDIEAIALEDCLAFYRRYYAPNNAVVILVGNVDLEEALVLLGRYYGPMEQQELPPEVTPAPVVVDAPRRHELELPISTDRVLMGWTSPSIHDPELSALDVGLEILLGGDSARLHKRLVTDLELASTVGGWASHFHYPGLVEIGVNLKSKHTAEEAEAIVLEELEALAQAAPSAREMQKALNQIEAALYRGLASSNAQAGKLGHYEVTAGDYRRFREAIDRIRRVKADDVREAVARYLGRDRRVVVVARPSAEDDQGDACP